MLITLETGRRDLWYRGTVPVDVPDDTVQRSAAINAETEVILTCIDIMLPLLASCRRSGSQL